ncbi:MAG: ADP-forming succinate--CoA ligase subunit beta [bacterium]
MNLHEYQGRELFQAYGIPVLPGFVATNPDEVREGAKKLGGAHVVVKAQVHAGGRGKAGGVKLADNPDQAAEVSRAIFKLRIKDLPVRKVLVAKAAEIRSEAYFGITLDRAARRHVVIASAAGGVDIEEVAAKTPDKIVRHLVSPKTGLTADEAMAIARRVHGDENIARQTADILMRLWKLSREKDTTLVEINPLVVDETGKVLALDSKVVLDDNGLFRHPELEGLRDPDSESKAERQAREAGLSYVQLDGDVGCCVNGAGLAMATMDLIKYYGGEPANFLDIGGSSSPEKVLVAMKIITADKNVRAIVFNIFGGITRCDDVARGIVEAVKKGKIEHPIVVRLTGTNEAEARKILADSGLPLTSAATMDDVVQQGIRLALQSKIA